MIFFLGLARVSICPLQISILAHQYRLHTQILEDDSGGYLFVHNLKTKKYCCCIHWNFYNDYCSNKLQLNNFVAMYYFLEFLSTDFHYNVAWNLLNARYHHYLQIFSSWKDKRPYNPKCPPLGKLLIWQTFWWFWLDFWIFNHSLKPPSMYN